MSQSAYSWCGTRLHLILKDDIAAAYNRAQDAFQAAQRNHVAIHGTKWDPLNEPILMDWTKEEMKAWEDVAKIVNLISEVNGGGIDIPEEEMTTDHLIKL